MKSNNSIEKRRYKRIKSDFDVRIKFETEQGVKDTINHGASINVNATGILLLHDKPVEIGKVINVCFLKPNSFEFFEGNAKVIRIELNTDNKTYEYGIQFISLTDEEEKKLDYYLTYSE